MSTQATRTIITDWTGADGHITRATEAAPAAGDVHRVVPPQLAAHEARAIWDDLDALIQELEPLIGWPKMDAILSMVNALQQSVRMEAIARMIHVAGALLDYPVSLYMVVSVDDALGEPLPLPRGEETLMELCGDDEALARRAQAELRRWLTHTEDAHDPQG